jgi:hypothetical protein
MLGTADGSQVLSFGGLTDNNTENLAMDLCLVCHVSCMLKTPFVDLKKCRPNVDAAFFSLYLTLHNFQWQSKVYVLDVPFVTHFYI